MSALPKLKVLINDEIFHDSTEKYSVISWKVNASFLNASSNTFEMEFTEEMRNHIFTNDRIQIFLDKTSVFYGFVEKIIEKTSNSENSYTISGRNLSGWWLSSDAEPTNHTGDDNYIIKQFISQGIDDLGYFLFKDIDEMHQKQGIYLGEPAIVNEFRTNIGSSLWEEMQRAANENNYYLYFDQSGRLIKQRVATLGKSFNDISFDSSASGGGKLNNVYSGILVSNSEWVVFSDSYAKSHGGGNRNSPAHQNTYSGEIDILVAGNVLSPVSGIVYEVGFDIYFGNYIIVEELSNARHTDKSWFHIFAHFSKVAVKINQKIGRNDILGVAGNTGKTYSNTCTGPADEKTGLNLCRESDSGGVHLHWEARSSSTTLISSDTKIVQFAETEVFTTFDLNKSFDGTMSIERNISDAKADVWMYASPKDENDGTLLSLIDVNVDITTESLTGLITTEKKLTKSKRKRTESGKSMRPDDLNVNNAWRTEGRPRFNLPLSRPGSLFRKRVVVSKSVSTTDSTANQIQRVYEKTAPLFEINISLSYLLNITVNSLVRIKYKDMDVIMNVIEVSYSESVNSQSTDISLKLPGRIR